MEGPFVAENQAIRLSIQDKIQYLVHEVLEILHFHSAADSIGIKIKIIAMDR
jgi:hypothetical protein